MVLATKLGRLANYARPFPVCPCNIYNRRVGLSDSFISTKIIATLGPTTRQTDVIVRLIEEGARLFRLNFSHGTFEDFDDLLASIRG